MTLSVFEMVVYTVMVIMVTMALMVFLFQGSSQSGTRYRKLADMENGGGIMLEVTNECR